MPYCRRRPGTVSARHAADLWVEAARASPGELTALITAPLTNFALAIRAEPRLPELLGKVVIMGGSFYHQGNTTPTAEWNTHVDPQAAKEVYAAYRGMPGGPAAHCLFAGHHRADGAAARTCPAACGGGRLRRARACAPGTA